MASPFDNPAAFAPFFRDRVAVEGTRAGGRSVAGTFLACVLDQGLDDAIAEGSTETARRVVSVTVRRADWFDVEPPQTGDAVTLESGDAYRVTSVVPSVGFAGWTLMARATA